jgi:drug/metabolite transporter, DME family
VAGKAMLLFANPPANKLHFPLLMAEGNKTSINPIFLVMIAVFIWSTGGMFIKLTSLDAYQVTFFRSLLAALTVLFATRRNGLRVNAFGILGSAIYATLLFLFVWATKHGTAANAIFLQYTAPVYILVLAPFIIGEKFHVRDLVTVVFCIAGMSLFFVGRLDTTAYMANVAALGSGIFLGLYIMLLRHPRALGMNSTITVIYGNFLLALLTAPAGIMAIPTMTATDIFAVSFLGIVQIGIAYILFIRGVTGGTRPLDASIIGFIEPLLNPVWVFLFVGEQPSVWALLGGAIIIVTVAAHTLNQYRLRPLASTASGSDRGV